MRSAVFVAILVATSALLAGCSSKKDDDHEDAYTCPDGTVLDLEQFPDHHESTFNPLSHCPKKGSSSNSTSLAPNVLPMLKLKVTDDGGNATNVTMLDGNLTFDATGSMDMDGQITGIAVSVTDSNTTRTASLFDATTKAFKTAKFKFDRPGVVNVTIALVDDRAGFTVNQTKVYVNHPQAIASQNIQLGGGSQLVDSTCGGMADDPSGTIQGNLYESPMYKEYPFALYEGATFVEATSTGGDITICSPHVEGAFDSTPVSERGAGATTSNAALPAPVGTQSYYVSATLGPGPGADVAVSVVVHYEPQAAAAA